MQPDRDAMGPVEAPNSVAATAGMPASRLTETIIAPFNEPDLVAAILDRHRGEIAAIIVEPVQFNIGVVPPQPGFLERLRELATDHGAVLIFDEVKTGVVIAYGGATEYFGVQPDLICLAKSIGGGVPIGAFGGRAEVMRVIAEVPANAAEMAGIEHSSLAGGGARVAHLGTFNGNPLSMTAGVVTLTQILTRDAYPRLHELADRLNAGCQEVIDEFGLPAYAVNIGPKGCVMFTPERVTNYRTFIGIDTDLWAASFFYLANRGILLPPGADDQWTLSVQHNDAEIDRYVALFRDFAAEVSA
jgi:glutamate-1-semialdehyde 2,1-aminomutase